MNNSNKAIIFLLVIILVAVVFFGIKLIGESNQAFSGSAIKEVEPIQVIKHEIYEQEVPETVEEEIIEKPKESPTEKQFETFKVERLDQNSGQALIFYEINPEDIRCPISEHGPIIFFDETKTYLGYEELKDFLNEYDIVQLLAFGGDNTGALQNIRTETGVSIMVKFGRADESEEPTYCWFLTQIPYYKHHNPFGYTTL